MPSLDRPQRKERARCHKSSAAFDFAATETVSQGLKASAELLCRDVFIRAASAQPPTTLYIRTLTGCSWRRLGNGTGLEGCLSRLSTLCRGCSWLVPHPLLSSFVYSILAEAHVLPYSKSRVSFGQLGNEFIPFIRK